MKRLQDDDIYAITDDSFAYSECIYCLCRCCMYLRTVCRNCFLCEFRPFPRHCCMWFVPYIFRRSPYKEWFMELEDLRIRKYRLRKIDLLDFKG